MWLIAALHSIKVENHHGTKSAASTKETLKKKRGHIRQYQFEF
jgi:hypothetical protein